MGRGTFVLVHGFIPSVGALHGPSVGEIGQRVVAVIPARFPIL